MTTANDKATIKKLKKQVTVYKQKEKATRQKLKLALSKVKNIVKKFEHKLDRKVRETKSKVAVAEAAVYTKLVLAIQKEVDKIRIKRTKMISVMRVHKKKSR